jgi:hypothetical protein
MRTTLQIDDDVYQAAQQPGPSGRQGCGRDHLAAGPSQSGAAAPIATQRQLSRVHGLADGQTPHVGDGTTGARQRRVISLLDVNVLVAFAWPNHVHHSAAQHWFDADQVVAIIRP